MEDDIESPDNPVRRPQDGIPREQPSRGPRSEAVGAGLTAGLTKAEGSGPATDEPRQYEDTYEKEVWRIAKWVAGAVVVLWATSGLLLAFCESPGVFGDMFGAVNALFSGLAFAGVVIAILLQLQEGRESRRQFMDAAKEQRDFYKAEREANEADHRRRRLEATMDYIATMSAHRRLDYHLTSRIPNIATAQESDPDALKLLLQLENLATGVALDAFDIQVVNYAMGGYLLEFYDRWFAYMQSRIDDSAYPDRLGVASERIGPTAGEACSSGVKAQGSPAADVAQRRGFLLPWPREQAGAGERGGHGGARTAESRRPEAMAVRSR